MGSGSSIPPDDFPKSEDEAKAAGYTDVQIKDYLRNQCIDTIADDLLDTPKLPHLKAPTRAYCQEQASKPREADDTPFAPANIPVPTSFPKKTPVLLSGVAIPPHGEKSIRRIQEHSRLKLARIDAQRMVCEQRIVNSIGERICLEIRLEVQKFLHSPAFVATCDEILSISDENRSGELDSTSQLVNAMNAVRTEMEKNPDFEFRCPLVTHKMARVALSDFDLDHNTAIDKEEFMQLSKILIIASLLNYDKPHEVAKYCLAAQGISCGKSGGMHPKPLALAPLRNTKCGLPSLKGTLAQGLVPLERMSRKANVKTGINCI